MNPLARLLLRGEWSSDSGGVQLTKGGIVMSKKAIKEAYRTLVSELAELIKERVRQMWRDGTDEWEGSLRPNWMANFDAKKFAAQFIHDHSGQIGTSELHGLGEWLIPAIVEEFSTIDPALLARCRYSYSTTQRTRERCR